MVGLERSTLPLIGEHSFGVSSAVAVLSFIVAFGLAKSFTNLGAGALAERVGRRRLLIAGWLVALPVPLLDRRRSELGLGRGRQPLPRREPGPGLVDDGGHEDRPRRSEAPGPCPGPERGGGLRRSGPGGRRSAAGSPLSLVARDVLVGRRRGRRALGPGDHRCSSSATPPSHVALEQARHHDAAERAPRIRDAFPDASYRVPALRSCSQAGLVNNLNDALDLGTGSALPRRARGERSARSG